MKAIYLYFLQISHSHIWALLLLSIFTSSIIQLLNWLFRALPQRENQVQSLMAPQIAALRAEYSGMEIQIKQRQLYHRYRYHPILALRSALPLFFQLPFLFAAFHALKGLPQLEGQSLGFIMNLAQPDAMILGYNVLPFVMTGINLLTAFINPDFRFREKLQAIFIAILFLALLYKAPAALLLYWSFNNLFFLLRTLVSRCSKKAAKSADDPLYQKFKSALPAYLSYAVIPFLVLILLTNFLELIADGEGLYFYRFSKTVPLFVCCFLLYTLVSWKNRIGRAKPNTLQPENSKSGERNEPNFELRTLHFELRTLHFEHLTLFALVLILHFTGIHPFPANRYVIFAYLSGAYLFLLLLKGIVYIIRPRSVPHQNLKTSQAENSKTCERSEPNSNLRTLNLEFLLLFLPAFHLAAVNPMYLSGWFYPLFLTLPFVLFGLAWLLLKAFSAIWQKRAPLPNRLISRYATAFAVLFCFLPVMRAMLQKTSAHDGDFWLVLLITISAIYLRSILQNSKTPQLENSKTGERSERSFERRTLNFEHISIITLFVLFAIHFGMSLIRCEKPSQRKLQEIPAPLQELTLLETPNIYLFVYDGVPNPRVFREQNLPLEPMQQLFERYGYKLYEDTYTLGNESLNSMAMTLNISGEQYPTQSKMQDIYSGNSVINLFLRERGYGSYNLLENYFTGTYAMVNEDLITEYYPPKVLSQVQSDFFLTLLRGVLQGEFRFDTQGIMAEDRHTEVDRQNRKYQLIQDQVSPKFVIDQVSIPSHSQNSGKCLPNETELWVERYFDALKYLEKDLETLQKYDPNSIAIFIGDHGPSLLGDCYVLQNYKREEITAELIWDRIGTLVAVRWPDALRAEKYDSDLTLNQDLFAVIFAYLADDPRPLELMPDRTFSGYGLLTRPAIRFRKGKVF